MKLSFEDKNIFAFIPAGQKHYQFSVDFLVRTRGLRDSARFLVKDLLNSADESKMIHDNVLVLLWKKMVVALFYGLVFPGNYYWGSGLTVDDRFKKRGLARRLIRMQEKVARRHDLNKIKAAVASHNVPIFLKLGFKEVKRWHILGYKLNSPGIAGSRSSGVRQAAVADLEKLEEFLPRSGYYDSCDRMYVEDLTWYPLDGLWLADLIKQGKVLLDEDASGIRGWAIVNKKSLINPFLDGSFSIMEIGYFDGDWTAILDFIRENYRPDFLRIYSAEGIPFKILPAEIGNGYLMKFDDLFGGLGFVELPQGRLFFSHVMLMQKTVDDEKYAEPK